MSDFTIVKIGGSCFESHGLLERLKRFEATLPHQPLFYITGGGGFADAVRDLDKIHGLKPGFSHALAISAMSMMNHVFAQLSNAQIVDKPVSSDHRSVLDVEAWLKNNLLINMGIEPSWNLTSDSLAAIIAKEYDAPLILLKSCKVPTPPYDWSDLAAQGIVDGCFPEIVERVRSVELIQLL